MMGFGVLCMGMGAASIATRRAFATAAAVDGKAACAFTKDIEQSAKDGQIF
jgi:hypothetical protein